MEQGRDALLKPVSVNGSTSCAREEHGQPCPMRYWAHTSLDKAARVLPWHNWCYHSLKLVSAKRHDLAPFLAHFRCPPTTSSGPPLLPCPPRAPPLPMLRAKPAFPRPRFPAS